MRCNNCNHVHIQDTYGYVQEFYTRGVNKGKPKPTQEYRHIPGSGEPFQKYELALTTYAEMITLYECPICKNLQITERQ